MSPDIGAFVCTACLYRIFTSICRVTKGSRPAQVTIHLITHRSSFKSPGNLMFMVLGWGDTGRPWQALSVKLCLSFWSYTTFWGGTRINKASVKVKTLAWGSVSTDASCMLGCKFRTYQFTAARFTVFGLPFKAPYFILVILLSVTQSTAAIITTAFSGAPGDRAHLPSAAAHSKCPSIIKSLGGNKSAEDPDKI